MGKAAKVTMLMGNMEEAHGAKGPDYAQEDDGYRKERPSDVPEDQEQGYDHQHPARARIEPLLLFIIIHNSMPGKQDRL